MPSDIQTLLVESASKPEARLDLEAAARRARRLLWLRRVKFATLMAVVGMFAATGVVIVADLPTAGDRLPPTNGRQKDHGLGGFVPAGPNDETYLLSDFAVEYPHHPVPNELSNEDREHYCQIRDCDPDPHAAGVTYLVAWSGNQYPGATDCRVELRDESGKVVGTTTWGLSVLDPSLVERGNTKLAVPVTAEPTSAWGVCEAGNYGPGPGYYFEFVGAERATHTDPLTEKQLPPGTLLVFDVKFLIPDPDTRICDDIAVHLVDGRVRHFGEPGSTFTIGEGPIELPVPIDDPGGVEDAQVTCRPYINSGS